jgi:hypothetical protein
MLVLLFDVEELLTSLYSFVPTSSGLAAQMQGMPSPVPFSSEKNLICTAISLSLSPHVFLKSHVYMRNGSNLTNDHHIDFSRRHCSRAVSFLQVFFRLHELLKGGGGGRSNPNPNPNPNLILHCFLFNVLQNPTRKVGIT